MAIASLYPTIKPSLLLDFANSKKLDPRVTFTRATSATYYDGVTTAKAEENLLLQSQNLVSSAWAWNGGYAGTLGAELVVDGDFSNPASWNTGGSPTWVIAGSIATVTNATDASITQLITTTSGTQYYVTADVVRTSATGGVRSRFEGGPSPVFGPDLLGSGKYSAKMVGAGNVLFAFRAFDSGGSFSGTLDNASLKIPTSDNVTAPDGTATAVTATADAANATFAQTVTAIAAEYTFSVYLRRVTGTGNIDITCDTAGTWVTQTITSSWARYTVTQTLTAGGRRPGIRIVTSGDQIEVWGAQLEQRSAATAYTPTTTQPITNYIPQLLTAPAGVPRFDHNPTTGESLGLLIEEQRTNLWIRSEQFQAFPAPAYNLGESWAETNIYDGSGNTTVSTDVAIAPNGSLSADAILPKSNNSLHSISRLIPTSGNRGVSFYVKSAGAQRIDVWDANIDKEFSLNLITGQTSSGAVKGKSLPTNYGAVNVGNGWFRVHIFENSGGGANGPIIIYFSNSAGSFTYAGDGYSGIYLWGAQLEAGAFPTSYIPTTSASVTRTADDASMTGTNFSSWYNQSESTFYAEWEQNNNMFNSALYVPATNSPGADANFTVRISGNSKGNVGAASNTLSANQFIFSQSKDSSVPSRAAVTYKLNDAAFSGNANTVLTDTTCVIAVASNLLIGRAPAAYRLNGTIKKLAYYPARLTNAQLQALTA